METQSSTRASRFLNGARQVAVGIGKGVVAVAEVMAEGAARRARMMADTPDGLRACIAEVEARLGDRPYLTKEEVDLANKIREHLGLLAQRRA